MKKLANLFQKLYKEISTKRCMLQVYVCMCGVSGCFTRYPGKIDYLSFVNNQLSNIITYIGHDGTFSELVVALNLNLINLNTNYLCS